MVTPCKRVPSEMIDALGMALDVDPAFFQLAIDDIHKIRQDSRGRFDFGPPMFERFGQFAVLDPYLYTQFLQLPKDATTRIQVGKSEIDRNYVIVNN